MGLNVERYLDIIDVRDLSKKVCEKNEDISLEFNDLIYDVYGEEDFDNFLKTHSDNNIWNILDLLSDNSEFKYIIEDLIIFDETSKNNWSECEGFASKKDFWEWKER